MALVPAALDSLVARALGPSQTPNWGAAPERKPQILPTLSAEQQQMIDVATDGRDIIVDACIGSGKTTSIQALCTELGRSRRTLYLTYSKLLKSDAQRRVRGAKVQNYHGIVYPSLLHAGIRCGISESIAAFNHAFDRLSATFPVYDLLVVDEYQDINEEYAQLLANIRSTNPNMQVVMVGDMAQKVHSNTTLDAQRFLAEFCVDPVQLPFTQSFRMGPELAHRLSKAWNKPVVGVNPNQKVSTLSYSDTLELLNTKTPDELLCLGKRNGDLSNVLNHLETFSPKVFNKHTVFASIRDSDEATTYGDDTAVFTTFDSSKGLERSTCVVFDFDEANWDMRNNFAGADHQVLRNVFLVAASRGKDEVVFVQNEAAIAPSSRASRYGTKPARTAGRTTLGALSGEKIGFIPIQRFTRLPDERPLAYDHPLSPSDAFDFKYAENVEAAFSLLEVERLDDGTSPVIALDRTDGQIDLSPVVGHYQEAVFFEHYNPLAEVPARTKPEHRPLIKKLGTDPWSDSLILAAISTDQTRYARQVTTQIPDAVRDSLVARLGTLLPRDAAMHLEVKLDGVAELTSRKRTAITFSGVIDALRDGEPYELKFVSELSHPMFLQLAMYLVMGSFESGVLWNTRTDERWRVRVPDVRAFMDAVVLCVSKQHYTTFVW